MGDFFRLSVEGRSFVGRVIRDDILFPPDPATWLLVYVYDAPTSERLLAEGSATPVPPDLLVTPEIVNRTGWTSGFFEFMSNVPLRFEEALPRHPGFHGEVIDETGAPLSPISDEHSVGFRGLGSYNTVGYSIRQKLGLPLLA